MCTERQSAYSVIIVAFATAIKVLVSYKQHGDGIVVQTLTVTPVKMIPSGNFLVSKAGRHELTFGSLRGGVK